VKGEEKDLLEKGKAKIGKSKVVERDLKKFCGGEVQNDLLQQRKMKS
jgi:hypothetical protein